MFPVELRFARRLHLSLWVNFVVLGGTYIGHLRLFVRLVKKGGNSIYVFPDRDEVNRRPTSRRSTLRTKGLLIRLPSVFRHRRIAIVRRQVNTLLVRDNRHDRIRLSLMLLLPSAEVRGSPPRKNDIRRERRQPPFVHALPSRSRLSKRARFQVIRRLFRWDFRLNQVQRGTQALVFPYRRKGEAARVSVHFLMPFLCGRANRPFRFNEDKDSGLKGRPKRDVIFEDSLPCVLIARLSFLRPRGKNVVDVCPAGGFLVGVSPKNFHGALRENDMRFRLFLFLDLSTGWRVFLVPLPCKGMCL